MFLINSCVGQSPLIVRDFDGGLYWEYDERYSKLDELEYFRLSFSIAELEEQNKIIRPLNITDCSLSKDTLNIRIQNIEAEGGYAVKINLFQNEFNTIIEQYSDIQEFSDSYTKNYPVRTSSLILNRNDYKTGDILKGRLEIESEKIENIRNNQLILKGAFQCVIR
ncbi:MAG: hypothetical protein ACNS60_03510 [Candidatus Cyclobacteriaceae bacterium M2_1C_046]